MVEWIMKYYPNNLFKQYEETVKLLEKQLRPMSGITEMMQSQASQFEKALSLRRSIDESIKKQMAAASLGIGSVESAIKPIKPINLKPVIGFHQQVNGLRAQLNALNKANNFRGDALANIGIAKASLSFESVIKSNLIGLNKIDFDLINFDQLNDIYKEYEEDEEDASDQEIETVNLQQIKQIVHTKIDESGLLVKNHFEDAINKLIEVAKGFPNSKTGRFLRAFIINMIFNILFAYAVSPAIDHSIEHITGNNTQIVKEIKQSVKQSQVPYKILNNRRFVIKDQLYVRQTNKVNSRLIGELKFGEVVTVIEKKRNWTLVEYIDEEQGIFIKGWTHTRYLERFK